MRRLGHILSIALITGGLIVIADVGITLAYQEPLSSIYSSIKQGEKASQLKSIESEFLTESDVHQIEEAEVQAKQQQSPHALQENFAKLGQRLVDESDPGDALGRIEAPGMDGLNMVFVQGTDESSLELGPGHYPETAMPGQGKTVAIAGHRTTYLAPFRHIDQIENGDKIRIEMPYAAFTYVAQRHEIVDPSDVGILKPVGFDELVMTACHPPYSASHRYALFSKLTRVDLFATSGEGRWVTP